MYRRFGGSAATPSGKRPPPGFAGVGEGGTVEGEGVEGSQEWRGTERSAGIRRRGSRQIDELDRMDYMYVRRAVTGKAVVPERRGGNAAMLETELREAVACLDESAVAALTARPGAALAGALAADPPGVETIGGEEFRRLDPEEAKRALARRVRPGPPVAVLNLPRAGRAGGPQEPPDRSRLAAQGADRRLADGEARLRLSDRPVRRARKSGGEAGARRAAIRRWVRGMVLADNADAGARRGVSPRPPEAGGA